MPQMDWGWGGICQCSDWGSEEECKYLSLSNPTHFISVTEKSVQPPPTLTFLLPTVRVSFVRNDDKKKEKKWNWLPTPDPSVCCEGIADWNMRGGGVWGTHVDVVDPCRPKQALHGHLLAHLSTPSSCCCRFNEEKYHSGKRLIETLTFKTMKKGSRDSRGWFSRNTRQHSWQQEEQHYVGAKSALVFNPEIFFKNPSLPPHPSTNWPSSSTWQHRSSYHRSPPSVYGLQQKSSVWLKLVLVVLLQVWNETTNIVTDLRLASALCGIIILISGVDTGTLL